MSAKQIVLLLVLVTFVLRLATVSPSLDCFDSVNFAKAVGEFDITRAQPHPPYYVVYIGLAKFFHLFVSDVRLSLIIPNVLLGSLAIIPVFYLAREFLPEFESLLAAGIYAASPLSWLFSNMALSDMTSAFFVITFGYLMIRWRKTGNLWLPALAFAFALGARQWNILFALLPIFVLGLNRRLVKFAFMVAIFCLVWMVPVMVDAGAGEYLGRAFGDAGGMAEVGFVESIFSRSAPFSPLMRTMLFGYTSSYVHLFNPVKVNAEQLLLDYPKFELIGMGAVRDYLSFDWMGTIGLIAAGAFLYLAARNTDKKTLYLWVWMVPYYLWLFLMQTPYDVRYQAALVAPLAVLMMVGFLNGPKSRKRGLTLLLAAFLVLSFARGATLAYELHTEKAPRLQAIEWMDENGIELPVVGYGQGKHFEWYAPEHDYTEYKIGREIELPEGGYIINKRAAIELGVETENCVEFSRDPMVYFLGSTQVMCEAS